MVARSADLDFEIRGFSYPSQATVATTPPRCRGYAARTSIRDSSSERLRGRRPFNHREFTVLATILDRTRKRLPFALCGYCFILDPIHAIIFPEETTTISNVMKSFKLHRPRNDPRPNAQTAPLRVVRLLFHPGDIPVAQAIRRSPHGLLARECLRIRLGFGLRLCAADSRPHEHGAGDQD